jgi:putative phage-type endonuclease
MITKIEHEECWHTLRQKHVGASEIAALFNASPYLTAYELYHAKRGELKISGENALTILGQKMEPIIADLINNETKWELKKSVHYYTHNKLKFLGCTPDYYITKSERGEGLLEIKNVQRYSKGWSDDIAPLHVEWQVQHQLLVVNSAREAAGLNKLDYCAIGSMHAGDPNDISIMIRRNNVDAQNAILERGAKFWDAVKRGSEPRVVDDRDYACVHGIFMKAERSDESVQVKDVEIDNAVKLHLDAAKQAKKLDAEAKKYKAQILDMLIKKDINANTIITNCHKIKISKSKFLRKAQPEKEVELNKVTIKSIG